MKLDDRLNPVEYDLLGGCLRLRYQTNIIDLDKSQRHALLLVLKQMMLID